MTLPVPFNLSHAMTERGVTCSGEVPLATAAWQMNRGPLREHRSGDLLLGHEADGTPVGLPDDRHVLLVGGTRGGKGTTVLVPNIIFYPGSMVVLDPKGENAVVGARARGGGSRYCQGRGQRVLLLDPFHAATTPEDSFADLRTGYNPLDLVHPDRPESIDDAARIADALVVTDGSKDPYWEESARGFIKAVILHVASHKDYEGRRNLVTVRALLMEGDAARASLAAMSGGGTSEASGLSLLFAAMKRNPAFNGVVAQAGAMFGNLEASAARTMANIAQIACTNTEFIESPGMQTCLTRSGFALHELKTDAKGLSLFICLPQAFMETHYRWLRMIITLLTGEMERHRQKPATGHPVLMVLDEFPALKRMRVIENAAAQIAGFGVRMVLAVQTLAQLKDVYKDNWETLVANAGVKMFFANDDQFTREYASKLIGEQEIVRTVRTVSETTGTSKSRADGRSEAHSLTESFSFTSSAGTNGGSRGSTQGKSFGHTVTNTTTHTDGTSTSRTVAHAETLHKRPLVTPDEVGRLFGKRDNPMALVLASGEQPMVLRRIPYYRQPRLEGSYDWHPSHPRPETIAARQARLLEDHKAREAMLDLEKWLREEGQREIDEANRKQAILKAQEEEREAREERRRALLWLAKGIALNILFTWSVWAMMAAVGQSFIGLAAFRAMEKRPPARKQYRSITGYVPPRAVQDKRPMRWIVFTALGGIVAQAFLLLR